MSSLGSADVRSSARAVWSRAVKRTQWISGGLSGRALFWCQVGVATLLYCGYTVFLTWPQVTDPTHLLSGIGISGDTGGTTSTIAYSLQHHVFPFLPATLHGQNAPMGVQQPWVTNLEFAPSLVFLYIFSWPFGAIAGANITTWLSYVLSALAMFLLVRRVFRSFATALLTGFAFGFFPWAIDKIYGHFEYMDGFVLVLLAWRMLELIDRPSTRNAVWAGLATAFAMWWTPYFILIGGVEFAVFAVVLVTAGIARRGLVSSIRYLLLTLPPIAVLFLALAAIAHFGGSSAAGGIRTQPILELYTYSEHAFEWFVPDQFNLFFHTSGFLTSHLDGSNFSESSLYLGDSVIILAVAGVALAGWRLVKGGRAAVADPRIRFTLIGGVLALVAAWFSAPPTLPLFGTRIAMPSDVIFHVTSTWRVFTRFVELIELGLCFALALSVQWLVERRRLATGAAVFAVLAAVLVLDLWSRPPVRAVSTRPGPEYVWLKNHPGGIVADYPLEAATYPDYTALFEQQFYRHPLFQGYAPNTPSESVKLGLADLAEPGVASYLAALHVKYVIVHPGIPAATAQTAARFHYRVRFVSSVGDIWQVGAKPARTLVELTSGFWAVEGTPGQEFRWMESTGKITIQDRSCQTRTCTGTLTFGSSSNGVGRMVFVREQGVRRPLATLLVPPGAQTPQRVSGIVLHHGRANLTITTNVPAALPSDGDPRQLSVNVQEPKFRLDPSSR
jgi:hypothetical protein